MKKRFNFTSALTVVLSSALIAMTTLPVLASNTNYDFDFSFDAPVTNAILPSSEKLTDILILLFLIIIYK